ncbi:TetR/AcrR family transcriptional regulator [Levilactobacillus spicheri]|uniref:TetR family transcriptional regulator n=2 Tax=Levilactobacillus spicheri TaxID=216463 RepID=A0ABQ0WRE7_9LACO|nr:TetR/AcrR family transcriptional regulator C-terminal ligand-binding domain-containing protein [Levilactobacillus spicheri]KRL48574.1 transcription regulator [Levilactobacillus spicheri DSM 15429]GEO67606.1 TetR family transcriptional regulator [Levilactobacillus spicheri]
MTQTRRRGADLEQAVYQATREILNTEGLSQLTFAKVAAKAQTSKPVIYRHWETPFSLALLAIQDKIKADNHGQLDQVVLTGESLAADLLLVTQRFTASMDAFGKTFMESWFEGVSHDDSAQLKQMLAKVRKIDLNAIDRVLERAVTRGELTGTDLPEKLKLLPFEWLRYRMLAKESIGSAELRLLVDDILVPTYLHRLGPKN